MGRHGKATAELSDDSREPCAGTVCGSLKCSSFIVQGKRMRERWKHTQFLIHLSNLIHKESVCKKRWSSSTWQTWILYWDWYLQLGKEQRACCLCCSRSGYFHEGDSLGTVLVLCLNHTCLLLKKNGAYWHHFTSATHPLEPDTASSVQVTQPSMVKR